MKSTIIFTFLLMLGHVHLVGQNRVFTIACGDQINPAFGPGKENHQIKIVLTAGERVEFKVIPKGDYLNVRGELKDPAGGMIYPQNRNRFREPMFTNGDRSLEIATGTLSATGTYYLTLYNNYRSYRHDERAGEYTLTITCYDEHGRVRQ